MNIKTILLRMLLILVIFVSAAFLAFKFIVYYVFFTERGARWITNLAINHSFKAESKTVDKMEGTLNRGFSLQGVKISGLEGLPPGNHIKIQELKVQLDSPDIPNAMVIIDQAKILLPFSEPILVQGDYKKGVLNVSIYSSAIDVESLLALFPQLEIPSKSSGRGRLLEVDLSIKEDLRHPRFEGQFMVEELVYKEFILSKAPIIVNLTLDDIERDLKMTGEILIKEGLLTVRSTEIGFKESRITFSGDPLKPIFSLYGFSKVGDVKMNLVFKGTLDKPELNLTSDPPMASEALLFMLATNKTWKGLEPSLNKKELSSDLVKDFVDFFILDGSGEALSKKLGIKDVWWKVNKNEKNVGVKKEISKQVDLGYEIQEKGEDVSLEKEVNHRLLGDLKVTDEVTFSFEKELEKKNEVSQTKPLETDDRIMLKYKTRF